jgi:GXWXG protein/Domain of unknown function (DUF4334)
LPDAGPDDGAGSRWLAEHRTGAAAGEVLSFFDALPPVEPARLVGRWRGSGLPTGSPLDGLLEAYGWWGKEVVDDETVHPLLFAGTDGVPRPVTPRPVPLGVLRRWPRLAHVPVVRSVGRAVRPLLTTSRAAARVRVVTARGVATAAVLYDALPVVDVLRRIDDDVLLGLMDMRGLDAPFFFVLHRDIPPT